MKSLNWNTTKTEHEYMRFRQSQNLLQSAMNPNETWAESKLSSGRIKWTRQAIWGKRLFDFWNSDLGIAVEIDGPEHVPAYDLYRDEYNFRRSAVVVLRVRNLNAKDMDAALSHILRSVSWHERRVQIGIGGTTKKGRRSLSRLPYPPSLLRQYLAHSSG